MLKSIKVKPLVYEALDRVREKRESFSDVIARLITVYQNVLNIQKPKEE